MAKNFSSIYEMCLYCIRYMSSKKNVIMDCTIHGVQLSFHIYILDDNFVFNSVSKVNSVFSLCTSDDTVTQVIIGNNITINSNITLTPPYRCKGLIIFDCGTTINNGIISMTSRGASAKGQNIYLYKNEYVPAQGASGGNAVRRKTEGLTSGNTGKNGTNRKTGGGASGGAFRGASYKYTVISGAGGNGTSYSGGAGGGGISARERNWTGNSGSSEGGAGGAGISNYITYGYGAGGGAGNPGGIGSYQGKKNVARSGKNGTGGFLIIYTNKLINNNKINSNGSSGGNADARVPASGGGSGGGSINIFASSIYNNGIIEAIGGAAVRYGGAKGGDGCVTITQIPINNIKINIVNSNIYKDSYYQEHFDFNKLIGGD